MQWKQRWSAVSQCDVSNTDDLYVFFLVDNCERRWRSDVSHWKLQQCAAEIVVFLALTPGYSDICSVRNCFLHDDIDHCNWQRRRNCDFRRLVLALNLRNNIVLALPKQLWLWRSVDAPCDS